MWRHEFWSKPYFSNQVAFPTWPKSRGKTKISWEPKRLLRWNKNNFWSILKIIQANNTNSSRRWESDFNGNIFLFLESIIFFACSLKEVQNFFIQSFRNKKYACFLYDQIQKLLALNIRKGYAHLFLLLKIFLDYFHINLFF